MKLMRKTIAALCLCLALCLAAQAALPVEWGIVTAARAASKVKLSKTSATVYVGKTLKLSLSGAKGTVSWSSSDPKVAKVSAKGEVTAKKAGDAVITAAAGGRKYTCKVKVLASLAVDSESITLAPGATGEIRVTWKLTGKIFLSWDDAAVASMQFSGKWKDGVTALKVKALKAGTTTAVLSNSLNKDTVKIRITVQDAGKAAFDGTGLMGLKVKAANKLLPEPLKKAKSGYANGYIRVGLDGLKRINEVCVTGGKGAYTLFGVYPGMKAGKAARALKKLGWKKAGRDTAGDLYASDGDTAHAIRLESDGGKLAAVTYFVP